MSFTVSERENILGGKVMEVIITSEVDIQLFRDLVNRAMNCWDRAPAKLKTFGDIVTEGHALQDYSDLGSEVKATQA